MRICLVSILLVGFLGQAQARDAEFYNDAQIRTRWVKDKKRNGQGKDANNQEDSGQTFGTRAEVGINMRKGETVNARLSLLNNFSWGSDQGVPGSTTSTATNDSSSAQHDGINNSQNLPLVREAWLWWKLNETMSVKFGRTKFIMGDKKVISDNDFEDIPYSLEGALVGWETSYSRFSFFGFKLTEFEPAGYLRKDAEDNLYGISADLKGLPEAIRLLHAHILQNVKDELDPDGDGVENTTYERGIKNIRIGLSVGGGRVYTYRLAYAKHKGTIGLGGTDLNWEGSMIEGEVGALWAGLKNSLFTAEFHSDSGNDEASPSEYKNYDPFLYDRHNNAGPMDVIGWGNLTYVGIGWAIDAMEDLRIKLNYYKFSRTEKEDTVSAGRNGVSLLAVQPGSISTETDIGTEFDLSAEHHYANGLSMMIRYSLFLPGTYLKIPGGPDDDFQQIFLESGIHF